MASLINEFPRNVAAADDVASLPPDVTHVQITPRTRNLQRLSRLDQLTHLWLGGADATALEQVVSCASLQFLVVGGAIETLPARLDLPQLRRLALIRMTRLASLQPLQSLVQLQSLAVLNGKRLTDYSPLGALQALETLEIGGDRHTEALAIESLRWITALSGLQRLSAGFTTIGDGSLRPLASLRQLRSLHIPNRFARNEFAWLAGQLPQVDCLWFAGYAECGNCPHCKAASRVMLTGKKAGIICRSCDQAKFAQLQAEFEAQVRASATDGGNRA